MENCAKQIDSTNPNGIEFHASEIAQGKRDPWKSYKKRKDRIEIIKKVLFALKDAREDTVLFACAVRKNSYQGRDPVELAFEDLISRFDMYLNRICRNTNEPTKGIIVFDKSSETSLQKLTNQFQTEGTRWRKLNSIAEVPLFLDSKASRIIQLADHIAYAVFRR